MLPTYKDKGTTGTFVPTTRSMRGTGFGAHNMSKLALLKQVIAHVNMEFDVPVRSWILEVMVRTI